jgi:putative membrane protein
MRFDPDMAAEQEDATRRTRLANERTYLAWWRTGLTSIAVGLAAGKLIPELSEGAAWPYQLLGGAYTLLGFAFILVGQRRQVEVERSLRRGEWAPLDARVAVAMTVAGAVLALGTVAVVLFAGR